MQGFIQAILISSRRHKKLNLLIEFWNSIFRKFYFEAYQNKLASSLHSKWISLLWSFLFYTIIYPPDVKRSGALPPDPPLGLHHGLTTKLTVPPDPHLHCRIILWSFFLKYNIRKLSLLSKMDISKTTHINHWFLYL